VDSILEEEPESWTTRLRLAKDQLVRSQVVMSYALIDELLGSSIARYVFGSRRSFPQLWRTKRFRLFNYHILEELSLLKKLRLVKAIAPMPTRVVRDIERLNSLRNALAHAFFPENLKSAKPEWKGRNILTLPAIEEFSNDMQSIFDYLMVRL
jgi:hypothetical protein